MIPAIRKQFADSFEPAPKADLPPGRRVGAELKFPLVDDSGAAAAPGAVDRMWGFLVSRGWTGVNDAMHDRRVGAEKPGPYNPTVASCETGYCKPEFSLAHVGSIHELAAAFEELKTELTDFARSEGIHFLGYGIQPLSRPHSDLLMKKSRTSVWDHVFGANRCLPPEDGDDVCLFTVNAASHVHVSVSGDEAIPALNAINALAGAQIAMTADSSVWRGRKDPEYRCVNEKLWDWWMPDTRRVGIPEKSFADLSDYVETIASFRPVFVQRSGRPIILKDYETFEEYFGRGRAVGIDDKGREVSFVPEPADLDLHTTCCWHNARLTRYGTVENRANDQQPPEDVCCIAAMTLGLVEAADLAGEEVKKHDWNDLRATRDVACRDGLSGKADRIDLAELAARTLEIAREGLRRRGQNEESFLAPLESRLSERRCPADDADEIVAAEGIQGLVARRTLNAQS